MPAAIGLLACAVSSLFFGSMFVPVKKFDAGNGLFVQWVMSAAILCVGMCVNAFQNFPSYFPLAMLGGALWAVGNATAVPIMNQLGIGMGMLIWGTTNCVMGWATGRFGLFGLQATVPSIPILNYLGLTMVIVGGAIFSQLKPTPKAADPLDDFSTNPSVVRIGEEGEESDGENTPLVMSHGVHRQRQRVTGIIIALFAGFLYGVTFVPVIYIQEHPDLYPGAPSSSLSYVFAHYCGVFLTATVIFLFYIIYSRNLPVVNPKIIGPSMIAGVMWSIAQSSWFIANDSLSQAITFPIITMVPGVCGALWSVVYFKEITGKQNLKILVIAVFVTVTGAVCVGVSK